MELLRPERWWVNVLVGLAMVVIAAGSADRSALVTAAATIMAMGNFFVAGLLWDRHHHAAVDGD